MEGWGCGEWSELKAGMQGVDWGVKNTHGRRKRNGKVLKNPGGFGLDLLGSHILNHGGFFFIQVVLNMKIHFHGALGGRFPLDWHGKHVHSYPSTLVLTH